MLIQASISLVDLGNVSSGAGLTADDEASGAAADEATAALDEGAAAAAGGVRLVGSGFGGVRATWTAGSGPRARVVVMDDGGCVRGAIRSWFRRF